MYCAFQRLCTKKLGFKSETSSQGSEGKRMNKKLGERETYSIKRFEEEDVQVSSFLKVSKHCGFGKLVYAEDVCER